MDIFGFRLRLESPLVLKDRALTFREGFAVRLSGADGNCGWGEVSPLPGFSRETRREAQEELKLLAMFAGREEVRLAADSPGRWFEGLTGGVRLSASVRFGVESAAWNLLAASKRTCLHKLLDEDAPATVPINGLLSGDMAGIEKKARRLMESGYRAFKLKVGRLTVDADADRAARVREVIGDGALLRLDANRAWNVAQARAFFDRAARLDIDYVEEPVQSLAQLEALAGEGGVRLPLALDESLLELTPEDLPLLPRFKAVVIKPTLLGFERSMRFARAAEKAGVTPVVSSSFESSLGLSALAAMAAASDRADVPVGLDTLDRMQDDLLKTPLPVRGGRVLLPAGPPPAEDVNTTLLEPVVR